MQVRPIRRELVRIAGAAQAHVHPALAQNIERRHTRGDVQGVVNGRQDHANAEADAAGTLAHRREGEVRGADMRPHGAEVMLRKPDARKAHLLGVGNLLQRFIDALGFTLGRPGFRHLNLVKQANSHQTVSCCVEALSCVTDARGGHRCVRDGRQRLPAGSGGTRFKPIEPRRIVHEDLVADRRIGRPHRQLIQQPAVINLEQGDIRGCAPGGCSRRMRPVRAPDDALGIRGNECLGQRHHVG